MHIKVKCLSTQRDQTWTAIVLGDKDEVQKLLKGMAGINSVTERASTTSKLGEENTTLVCQEQCLPYHPLLLSDPATAY